MNDQSLKRCNWIWEVISPLLSLAIKSRFPETETAAGRDRFDIRALLRGEAQDLVLARPFGWQIAKTDYAHTVRQSALNGRLDEIRRQKRERDSHVDLPGAASFSLRNAFVRCRKIGDEFVKPTSSARN